MKGQEQKKMWKGTHTPECTNECTNNEVTSLVALSAKRTMERKERRELK